MATTNGDLPEDHWAAALRRPQQLALYTVLFTLPTDVLFRLGDHCVAQLRKGQA